MYNSDFCQVTYDLKKDVVLCRWKQFCKGEDYKAPLRYGLKLIAKHQPKIWITDTTNGFESDPEDTAWLLESFLPQTIESSIEKVVFIIAPDSPLMAEIEGQAVALREFFEVALVEKI